MAMVRKVSVLLFVAALVFAFAGCSEAANVNLRIINDTGYTVYKLYVSPASSSGWGSDRLGSSVLMNGEDFTVRVQDGTRYDVRLEDEDGDTYTKQVRPNGNWRVTFTISDLDS